VCDQRLFQDGFSTESDFHLTAASIDTPRRPRIYAALLIALTPRLRCPECDTTGLAILSQRWLGLTILLITIIVLRRRGSIVGLVHFIRPLGSAMLQRRLLSPHTGGLPMPHRAGGALQARTQHHCDRDEKHPREERQRSYGNDCLSRCEPCLRICCRI
jgi:hypothetical protein